MMLIKTGPRSTLHKVGHEIRLRKVAGTDYMCLNDQMNYLADFTLSDAFITQFL